MAEMHKSHLIERLRECLPTAADGPDNRVWCSVRGSDLREAVAELEVQREALTAAMDEVDRLRAEVATLQKSRNDDGHLVLFVERAIRQKP
jgi:polyhydroxyalkanoate synthesis regulator phasin